MQGSYTGWLTWLAGWLADRLRGSRWLLRWRWSALFSLMPRTALFEEQEGGGCDGSADRARADRRTRSSSTTRRTRKTEVHCHDAADPVLQKVSGSEASEVEECELMQRRKAVRQPCVEEPGGSTLRLPSEQSGSSDRSSRVRWALEADQQQHGTPSSEDCGPFFVGKARSERLPSQASEPELRMIRKVRSERSAVAEDGGVGRKARFDRAGGIAAEEDQLLCRTNTERREGDEYSVRKGRSARLAAVFGDAVLERERPETPTESSHKLSSCVGKTKSERSTLSHLSEASDCGAPFRKVKSERQVERRRSEAEGDGEAPFRKAKSDSLGEYTPGGGRGEVPPRRLRRERRDGEESRCSPTTPEHSAGRHSRTQRRAARLKTDSPSNPLPVLLGSNRALARSKTLPELGEGFADVKVGGGSMLRPPSPAGLNRRRTIDCGACGTSARPTTPLGGGPLTPEAGWEPDSGQLPEKTEKRHSCRPLLLEPLTSPAERRGSGEGGAARTRKRSSPAASGVAGTGPGRHEPEEAWASRSRAARERDRCEKEALPSRCSRRSFSTCSGESTLTPLGKALSVVSTPEAGAPTLQKQWSTPQAFLQVPPLPLAEYKERGPCLGGPIVGSTSGSHSCLGSPTSKGEGSFSWKKGRRLGAGSYGCVYAALGPDGHIFAVKQSAMMEDSADAVKYREKLEEELRICQDLRHQNIVSYLGHDWLNTQLYLYLEYMAGGSMATVLSDFGKLHQKQLTKATGDLFAGLTYLHSRSPPVVHRDVKGANLLVSLTFDVKLADFGLSRRNQETRSLTMIGSIPWMAPEVIQQQDGHGRKADIWSAGCTIIEMSTAEKPWGRGAFDNLVFALKHIGMTEALPDIPQDIDPDCQDLIRQCIQRPTENRPSAKEALRHAFLRDGSEFK